ncbi:serine hydrolase domain-containing protein [Polymorphobacter fuscus]|uniref:Serine hydrolase n=1 Tax=Sandarakinorhabdus fusca TaxID=1439888 RepID=A0A7C9GN30_9SPHN|nr:serine hydrolase domain-containing protein [Polymorphobacter fuscus]KAB7648815.1 beta-lactamase family protein [Polymorphobacter fuscus]MQT16395.1 serine hydrolase [Polymorphobacter fuscus]NJC07316.1 CubicO group peptidase (beta-lactamase class C family) [Polymorphobacter fuscus]
MIRMLALAFLFAGPAAAAPLDDLVAGHTAATRGLAGLVVVVADGKGIVRSEAYGAATIDPPRPITVATPFRVASVSKAVVAIGVLRLVEAGTLDLDSDVSRWLGWPLRNPAFPDAPVTLRQLLSHTAGIVDGPGYVLPLGVTLRDAMANGHWSPAAPGGRFAYANLNYGIVATVMEAATSERFDRLMTRLVLAPLDIDGGYNWSGASDAAIGAAAALYRTGKDETAIDPDGPWVAQVDDMRGVRPDCPVRSDAGCDLAAYVPGTNGALFSPQGGLRISALGLAKIGRMLLGGGKVDGVRLLSPASVATLMTPVWQASDRPQDNDYAGQMRCYGPGLQCLTGGHDSPVPGARWWGHLGEAYGLLAGLWVDTAGQRVLVYALTGSRDDPTKPAHVSAFPAVEEAILASLAATPTRR